MSDPKGSTEEQRQATSPGWSPPPAGWAASPGDQGGGWRAWPPPPPPPAGPPPVGPPGWGSWGTPVGPPSPPRRRSQFAALLAGVVLLAAAIGGLIGHQINANRTVRVSIGNPPQYSPYYGQAPSGAAGSGAPSNVAAIASQVAPALVDVNTSYSYQQAQGAGTGIVLTPNGEILTNNHVINGATKISVTDIGNGKTYGASVVGYDPSHDVAVLQLQGASGLQTAKLATGQPKVGEAVVGVGNAGGAGGAPSAAGGSVAAVNRSITAADAMGGTSEQLTGLIQVSAAIQAGDSGGPLVNSSGQVIGMDTAASQGFSFQSPDQSSGNVGFAIPIGQATTTARLITSGKGSATTHIGPTGFLGVLISPQGSQSASGAAVSDVVSGGPADQAGLAGGDVLTAVNGQPVTAPTDISHQLLHLKPGSKVQLAYVDGTGQSQAATVTLTSGPPA